MLHLSAGVQRSYTRQLDRAKDKPREICDKLEIEKDLLQRAVEKKLLLFGQCAGWRTTEN